MTGKINYEKELVKQRLIIQAKDKHSPLYYLLRIPNYPFELRRNEVFCYPKFFMNAYLNIIPAYDVYEISFEEYPDEKSYFVRQNALELYDGWKSSFIEERITIRGSHVVFELRGQSLIYEKDELQLVTPRFLSKDCKIEFLMDTGEIVSDNYKTFNEFYEYCLLRRTTYAEKYFEFKVTQELINEVPRNGQRPCQLFFQFLNETVNSTVGGWAMAYLLECLDSNLTPK